jgi:hypothetical protein
MLYNLKNDLGEKIDLAEKYPEKAAEMNDKLQEWLKYTNAKIPVLK